MTDLVSGPLDALSCDLLVVPVGEGGAGWAAGLGDAVETALADARTAKGSAVLLRSGDGPRRVAVVDAREPEGLERWRWAAAEGARAAARVEAERVVVATPPGGGGRRGGRARRGVPPRGLPLRPLPDGRRPARRRALGVGRGRERRPGRGGRARRGPRRGDQPGARLRQHGAGREDARRPRRPHPRGRRGRRGPRRGVGQDADRGGGDGRPARGQPGEPRPAPVRGPGVGTGGTTRTTTRSCSSARRSRTTRAACR